MGGRPSFLKVYFNCGQLGHFVKHCSNMGDQATRGFVSQFVNPIVLVELKRGQEESRDLRDPSHKERFAP